MQKPILLLNFAALATGLLAGAAFMPRPGTAPASSDTAAPESSPSPRASRFSRSLSSASPDSPLPDVAACRARLAELAGDSDLHPLLRRMQYQQALRRWLELDPASAMAEAEKNPAAPLAADLMIAYAELDPAHAIVAMNAASLPLARAVTDSFFIALLSRDPRLASQALSGPDWPRKDAFGGGTHAALYRQWTLTDPTAAISMLSDPRFDGNNGSGNRMGILQAWAESDFAAAWSALCATPASDPARKQRQQADADTLIAAALLKGSPEALALASGLLAQSGASMDPNFDRIGYRASQIARSIAGEDPLAAAELAHSIAGQPGLKSFHSHLIIQSANRLATADPHAALAMLKEVDGYTDYSYGSAAHVIFNSLAAENSAAAADLLPEIFPSFRPQAMSGLLMSAFTADPAAAQQQLGAWLADPAMAQDAATAWAEAFSWGHGAGIRDPGPTLAAYPQLGDAVDHYVLEGWVQSDPSAATAWITQRLVDGKKIPVSDSGGGVFGYLGAYQPQLTAAWIPDIPSPEIREKAANTLTANWAAYDPAAARAWIDTLPAGPLRTAAETGLTRATPPLRNPADPFQPGTDD